MSDEVVLGLDGGGTRTRVVMANLDGHVLGTAERGGATIEFNDPDKARENLRNGVQTALANAGRSAADVMAATAGVGGLTGVRERAEAERAIKLAGLTCGVRVVSDAVVAHVGAFRGDPGIIAIGGTGSTVYGITVEGEEIHNYEYLHYARAGAHNLGERALHTLLAGEEPAGWPLKDHLLEQWECKSVAELRGAVREEDRFTNVPSGNPFDSVAPLITAAAAEGDAHAQDICDEAVGEVTTGVRIVGGAIDNPIGVAPAGSVLRSTYMTAEFRRQIGDTDGYQYVEPAMSPVAGAVFDALDRVADADDGVVERLTSHPIGRP